MVVENQVFDFDEFLNGIELVVVMVGHKQLIDSMEKLNGKIILDTRNICKDLPNVYKL